MIPGHYTSDDLDALVVERDRQRAKAVASWEANGYTVHADCDECQAGFIVTSNAHPTFRKFCTALDCELGVG